MRIAILSAFPVHFLPGFEDKAPQGHYATWLPQLSAAWEGMERLEVHWVVVTRDIQHPAPIMWRGQHFHLIQVRDRMRFLRLYWKDCHRIRTKLEEIKPHLVHAWGTEDCYGLAAVRSGRRFVLSMQGILSEYERRVRIHPYERFQAVIERYVLRRTEFATVESTWGAEVLAKYLPPRSKIDRVEYGVQQLFYQQCWAPKPDEPIALFVGTADRRKGLEDVLGAFSTPGLSGARLWVVGAGPEAERLRPKAPKNVEWLGRLNREQTAARMAAAWCLVLPTRADTSPNVVKEARVLGMPVITTPCGGQRDYIEDGKTGWIVEPGDVPGLTNRVAQTLGDIHLAQRLGATRHAEHRAWFRPERTAAGFLQIYRSHLSDQQAP